MTLPPPCRHNVDYADAPFNCGADAKPTLNAAKIRAAIATLKPPNDGWSATAGSPKH